MLLEPEQHPLLQAVRMSGLRAVERISDLMDRGRHGEPDQEPTATPTTRKWRNTASDCGMRCTRSHVTPGRIADAKVTATTGG